MPKTHIKTSLSSLPSVDSLLRTETARAIKPLIGVNHLTSLARQITDELRREILAAESDNGTAPADNGAGASL